MTRRQSMIGWGLVLVACAGLCLGLSVGQAQPQAKVAPENILPADAILYVNFDGNAAHSDAWEKTAAYEALYETGLMEAIQKTIESFSGKGPANEQMKTLGGIVETLSGQGLSLAVRVNAQGGPPLPQAVVVLHGAAEHEPKVAEFVRSSTRGDVEFETKDVNGRSVTAGILPDTPGVEVGWWTEGGHLIAVAGIDAANTFTGIANGDSGNITTGELWKKYKAGPQEFDVLSTSWLDFGALRELFGEMPLPLPPAGPDAPPTKVNDILDTLGLGTLGAVVTRSGYKGRAMWSETMMEAPGEKKGLMALGGEQSMTLEDLPPLPFGHNGFYACSHNLSATYSELTTLAQELSKYGPPDAAAQVEGLIANLPAIAGFDPKADLLDALGNVICVYGDTRQGMFGMGAGLAISVKDPDKLKATLKQIGGMIVEQSDPDDFQISTREKQNREIVTYQIGKGMFNPSYAVDDKWLIVGLMPQTVEAFLLRVDGKLTNWRPTTTYRDAFQEMPQEFTSIMASDPRKSVRALMGFAPILMPIVQQGLRQSGLFPADQELPVTVADLPPAEQVARPLFPTVAMCVTTEAGCKWVSRSSLPAIPLLGSGGGAGGVAAASVAVALLLPAVQQAREAARRSQSKNNLKQLALAMHNYHDAHNSFPQGTHPNDDLKPEKRLSWVADVLPYLDQGFLHEQIDFDKAWDAEENSAALETTVSTLINPGIGDQGEGHTHYVGIAGVGKDAPGAPAGAKDIGIFGYNRVTRFRDITDGTSNTVMLSEAGSKFGPWGAGGDSTLRAFTAKPYINGPDGIGGPFRGGCNMGLADGSVRFISENIDPSVMENLARMADGNVVGDF